MSNDAKPAGIGFLDFIFTVSMSIGLTPELLQLTEYKKAPITGMILEGWVVESRFPNWTESLNIGVFILAFLTLTLSWYGYHASLVKRPHTYDSGYDMIRFILDVVVDIIYGIMMIRFKNINIVIFLLGVVFLIYAIWDFIKIKSREEKYGRRERVTIFWFGFIAILNILYFFSICGSWCILTLALVAIVLYRVNKEIPLWERIIWRSETAT